MYYQFIDSDLGVLDNPINKEYMVLDSTKSVNDFWFSQNLGPNSTGGGTIPISSIVIRAEITAKALTQTVQGITYNNIIEVTYNYTVTILGVPTLVATEKRWYAKGFGLIYDKIIDVQTSTTTELETTRIQIF